MADDPSTTAMADDPSTTAMADDPSTTELPAKKALETERAARKDAERRLKELEDRDKSELQKLQDDLAERDARLADLPKQARTQAIRFASQATAAGFLDPEDALLNLADVDLADSDAVKAALEALAERKPHLIRQDIKKKPPTRPKPAKGDADDDATGGLTGKQRAAAALRQMRN